MTLFYFSILTTPSTITQPASLLSHRLVSFLGSTIHNKSFHCFKNHLVDFLQFDSKAFCWGCFCILLRDLWTLLTWVFVFFYRLGNFWSFVTGILHSLHFDFPLRNFMWRAFNLNGHLCCLSSVLLKLFMDFFLFFNHRKKIYGLYHWTNFVHVLLFCF